MPRIVLVTSNEEFGVRLRSITNGLDAKLIQFGEDLQSGDIGVSAIIANQPDVVIFGPQIPLEQAREWTEIIDQSYRTITCIWTTEPSAESWRSALQSGARDLIDESAGDAEIRESLIKAIGIHDRRYTQTTAPTAVDLDVDTGRVITVASPKGGTGKTMLSTNLAYGLRARTEKPVVLVDLDLQFGDVAGALYLRPEYSVLDGLRSSGDATSVKAFLTQHPSGLYVLPAPTNPIEADEADHAGLAKMIDLLKDEFAYVVVDTGAGVDETTLTAIEQSTDVAFVTSTDLAAIQAMRKAILVLDQLEMNKHRRWYVLNRADARVGLGRDEVEESTGISVDVAIPSSRSVPAAMNQGKPVLEADPRGAVGRALNKAVDLFLPESEQSSTGGSWFKRRNA